MKKEKTGNQSRRERKGDELIQRRKNNIKAYWKQKNSHYITNYENGACAILIQVIPL